MYRSSLTAAAFLALRAVLVAHAPRKLEVLHEAKHSVSGRRANSPTQKCGNTCEWALGQALRASGLMVTRLAWIAQRFAVSNRFTRYASAAASCSYRRAMPCGAGRGRRWRRSDWHAPR